MIENLSDSNIENIIRNNAFVLVDCYTEWCGPCKAFAPVLESFASQNRIIKVIKIDVERNPIFAKKYNIRSVPTLLFFERGQLRDTKIGMSDLNTLNRLYKR